MPIVSQSMVDRMHDYPVRPVARITEFHSICTVPMVYATYVASIAEHDRRVQWCLHSRL